MSGADGETGTPARQAFCAVCGTATTDGVPLTWSTERTERGVVHVCDRCLREHARSVEARLRPEDW